MESSVDNQKNFRLYAIVGTFVLCGTLTTTISSVTYNMQSEGRDGEMAYYKKPLFANAAMFLGMSFCLLIGPIKKCLGMGQPAVTHDGYSQLTVQGGLPRVSEEITWKVAKKVTLPAICDWIATQLMNIGLLWMDASIWQMLRGSIILWTALIRMGWLKKPLMKYQWMGVFLVVAALGVIGASAVLGSNNEANHTEQQQAVGITLVMLGMFVQAIQTVAEENLLTSSDDPGEVKTAPFIVVGIEGLWGLGLSVVMMPVVAAFPESWAGLHEDTIDTFIMLGNNGALLFAVLAFVVVVSIFNIVGLMITQVTSSVTRNVLDSVRTVFIWITMVVIYYTGDGSLGESWQVWSWLQLGGFLLLVAGVFTYNSVVQWSCFQYEQ